jgi:choice-of-anchor A domain-containing protein/uncharacterized repeat protein (TIGR01451 family)
MKNLTKSLTITILLLYSVLTYSAPLSISYVTGTDQGVNVTLPAPFNSSVFAGTFKATINGNNTKLYCIDLYHSLIYNDPYQDVESTNDTLSYILNNYFPFKTSYPGKLTDNKREAAAVQLALWHLTDGLDINLVTGTSINDIKTRALAIVADALLNAHSFNLNTFFIYTPPQTYAIGQPITFSVQAYNDHGLAMPNVTIALSTTGGTLSQTTVTTDSTGVSPLVTLTPSTGLTTATITATGVVGIPSGTKYYNVANPNGKQKLILATPTIATRTITKLFNWVESFNLVVNKVADRTVINNGDIINYTIKVRNLGPGNAQNVTVSDQLQPILDYISSTPAGVYNATTGIWTVGNLNAGDSSLLVIKVRVDYNNVNATTYSFGAAADYNLFVIDTLIQPSADTEGKVAVGGLADLRNYSVGDKLALHSGHVLVVGTHLTFISGRVYNGSAVYKDFITSTTQFTADDGIFRDSIINFNHAKTYLEDLSNQLSSLAQTDTISFQWGHVELVGHNSNLNVFNLNGSLISQANNFTVNAPAGSTVLVNVIGDSITWKGGFQVVGTTQSKVLFNFRNVKVLNISNIDVKASVLAPKAVLNFPSGIITGQVIVRCMFGSGQFNLNPFNGVLTRDTTIANFATILSATQGNMPVFFIGGTSGVITSSNPTSTTGTKDKSELPGSFNLEQNYPNPFNPSTSIRFSVSKKEVVSLTVFNSIGEVVNTLVNGEFEAGSYEVKFNSNNLPSGIYLYRLSTPSFTSTKKMILQK